MKPPEIERLTGSAYRGGMDREAIIAALDRFESSPVDGLSLDGLFAVFRSDAERLQQLLDQLDQLNEVQEVDHG